MANANGWGDGASNNNIGWGKGADNAIGWGSVYSVSSAGATDIVGTPAVDPDAQAFITAASITDPTQQSAINTLVTDLKGYSIWTKFKAIYPIVGGSASSHSVNLKTPGTYNLTFASGWTHSANGMTPLNTYANTNLNDDSILSLNSVHISYYSRTNSNGTEIEMGVGLGDGLFIEARTSGTSYYRVHSSSLLSHSDSDSRAFYLANRTASNLMNAWKNNSKVATGTGVSTIKQNYNIYIGNLNNAGTAPYPSTKQCAFASIGDGLTDTEVAQFSTTVEKYQTTLGRSMNPWYDNGALLLDTYQNSSAAYSLRKLRNFYIGAAIRVRRSSDNTEQDIYFNSTGNLDTTSLLSFVGAGNGFVTTWYDQSGNSKDTTQSTAANQPRIVNAGSIDLVNSKPAILGDGVNDTLINSALSLTNPTSIFTVVDKVGTSGAFGLYSGAGLSGAFLLSGTGFSFYQNGPSFSPDYNNNNQSLLVAKTATTGTNWELYGNNTTVTNGGQNIGTTIGDAVSLFDRSGSSYRSNMYMQEFIVWNSNQMTNRAGIQTEINTYYTIY